MTYKATIDVALNISLLRMKMLNRQGFIRYRLKLFSILHKKEINCHPYNIIKGPTHNQKQQNNPELEVESEIDPDQCYYSKVIPVRYRGDDWEENQTVCFRSYVDVDQLDSCQFYCEAECMFSEDPSENFELIGQFKAQIRKIHNISTYLPITFDEFEGFTLSATFHAIIMEFKYDCSEEFAVKKPAVFSENNSYDFWSYLDSITSGFGKEETRQFYDYYRSFLEHELFKLQERHSSLLKKKNLNEGYTFTKLTKSFEVFKAIESIKSKKIIVSSASDQEKLVQAILDDFTKVKAQIYKKWMNFITFLTENSAFLSDLYQKEYKERCNDRFKNNVFSHRIKNHDWRFSMYEDSGRSHIEQAYKEKKKIMTQNQLWNEHFPIENCRYFGKSETHIKMFEEVYENSIKHEVKSKFQGRHIIVLVHGFQASRDDFLLLKSCLQINYNVQIYVSTCNEGITEEPIQTLGKRLAIELSKILVGNKKQYRLSFIGHSLGGLIVRAAIPYIKQFSEKFYSYISLSTPHLGYLYTPPTLIQAGLWFLNTWQKCESIQEISMRDDSDFRNTTLYQLSSNSGLTHFKKICFIGSSQDDYVPYESARVEENRKLIHQKLKEPNKSIISEMVTNMLSNLSANEISRINVVFNIPDKNLDSFIGRTGHVKYMSDTQFIKEFCCCFAKFFE